MEIPDIKSRLSLSTVLSHYGIKPDRTRHILCPFHEDTTPSCRIYPETNTFHCFGCGATGDQIEFIQRHDKCSKHEAIQKAVSLLGTEAKRSSTQSINNGQRCTEPVEVLKIDNAKPQPKPAAVINTTEILTYAFTHFARSLNFRPPQKAIDYLESRQLDPKLLTVGYDAGTLHKMKETTPDRKQEYLRAGLLKPDKFGRENQYYTRFSGCIVFPLLNKNGNIAGLYGRHIEGGHHYLEGAHKGLYPCYPKETTQTLILTEAIIDAASIVNCQLSIVNYSVLALYGTNGFTDEHEQAVASLPELKEVVLFFDGAGRAGVRETAAKLKQINNRLQISAVDTPGGEDINSLSIGHTGEVFAHLIENRKPFSFSIEKEKEREETPDEKEETINQKSSIENQKLTITADYLRYETSLLIITLWGGIETHTVSRLRATLHIQLKNNPYMSFRDTADLYSHSQSDRLIKQASEKLEISSNITSEAIAGLTAELENYRTRKREEKRQSETTRERQNLDRFSREQMQQANDFMNAAGLTSRTHELLGNLGMVGQQDNATLLFFIFLTRFFKNPLHAIVMGSSGSGKTHLLQGVAGTVPRQHINITTSLSENTLYYTPKDFLKHKILLQEDLDGAYNALLPLRELMSNQSISRFSTKTNSRTGDSKQVYLHVEGPVCVAGATTKDKVYEDNANRSFLIQIEENPRHESEVLKYQGQVAAGLIDLKHYDRNIALLKACQLLIEPLEVVIPFAPQLQLPPHVFKKMRTMNHYLTLIKSVTLWNRQRGQQIFDQHFGRCRMGELFMSGQSTAKIRRTERQNAQLL